MLAVCFLGTQVGDSYYCSDANSTAYKYPMVDAKVVIDKDGEPVAEVPFDGTVYSEPLPALMGSQWTSVCRCYASGEGEKNRKRGDTKIEVYINAAASTNACSLPDLRPSPSIVQILTRATSSPGAPRTPSSGKWSAR